MARRGMTDHERGMRMVETEELYLFLEAYEQVTGEALELTVGLLRRNDRTFCALALPAGSSALSSRR